MAQKNHKTTECIIGRRLAIFTEFHSSTFLTVRNLNRLYFTTIGEIVRVELGDCLTEFNTKSGPPGLMQRCRSGCNCHQVQRPGVPGDK